MAPEREEFCLEPGPDRLDGVEQPAAVRGNRVRFAGVAALREIAEHQIGEECADIEADGAEEREFSVDDPGVGLRHHHRTGVEIAVQQRLAARQECPFELLHRDLQRGIGAKRGREPVKLG